ncbi:signal transduction histidine kinase [Microvirga lupini]|uniref:Signal transduction histidine kinase n=1 Tax=Microvirga lupini TaxID=420324 RepID=A0A7W4VQP4_9HYPH|nr:PAS domain-containing protein [Microvirga lupini]MBB3021508.1 signal transduction histidine kinase [Microvirga lupini]
MFSSVDLRLPTLGVADRGDTHRSIILIAASTIGLSLLTTWTAVFWHAYGARHEIAHHGLVTAISATHTIEREAQAMGYLLKGLSQSPLLKTGDLEGFHRQLRATPRPDGAWFTLWDRDRVLLRTRDPFGATLPRIDELSGIREQFEAIRTKSLIMSDRMHSPSVGLWIVSISLRLDDAGGKMNGVLSLHVPEMHFNNAVRNAVRPTEWGTVLLDRKLQRLVTGAVEWGAAPLPGPASLLSGRSGEFETIEGYLTTFERSSGTGYTAVSVLPTTLSNAPIRRALYQSLLATLALFLIGGIAVRALLRNVGPIDSLRLTALATRSELVAANARMGNILESITDCYFTLDYSYRITNTNSATLRWCGKSRSELIGRRYLDLVDRHSACAEAVVQAVEHRREYRGEVPSALRPDRFIELRAFPSPEGASVYFCDVTDRVLAHRATVEERELLQASLDALTKQIAILDGHGRIIAVNQAWCRFIDATQPNVPAHGTGSRYLDVAVPGEQRFSAMEDVIADIRPGFQGLYQTTSPDGDRWFMIRARRFRIGGKARIIVSHEEVTELMIARASVNELSERLLTLQDEERQRIAAELHDSTTQYLVAVGLNLMKIERLLPQRDGQRLLDEIDHLLEEALKELRLFTYLLHPASLEENGFREAVRAFADGFSDRTGLEVACRFDGGADRLRVEVRRALFRIVQEALSNVHRHAAASRVTVNLRNTPDEVILCVADDGHGMQANPVASKIGKPTLGVGIPGMRIRLHQFGGTLRIRTGRTGTVIRARVPRKPENLAGAGHGQ